MFYITRMNYHRGREICVIALFFSLAGLSQCLIYFVLWTFGIVDAVEHEVCGQRAISKVEAMDLI